MEEEEVIHYAKGHTCWSDGVRCFGPHFAKNTMLTIQLVVGDPVLQGISQENRR